MSLVVIRLGTPYGYSFTPKPWRDFKSIVKSAYDHRDIKELLTYVEPSLASA